VVEKEEEEEEEACTLAVWEGALLPVECASLVERLVARVAVQVACERAPVQPPRSAAIPDLTKCADLHWPLAAEYKIAEH
jgi:hypothetical protein